MLAFAIALIGSVPMVVEATGMEPQLRFVRQEAANRNWPITCVGHAGELGVVRVGFPPDASPEAVDGFIKTVTPVVSSVGNVGADASKQTCDQKPVQLASSEPIRTLTFTKGERDARLLAVAQECGYAKTYWRPTRPEDVATFKGQIDATKYSTTLDAGEDANARYGPLMCFINMGLTPLITAKR